MRAVRGRLPAMGLVLLLFALGLMCKPMLVTLPVVLLLLDYWPLQRVESRKLWAVGAGKTAFAGAFRRFLRRHAFGATRSHPIDRVIFAAAAPCQRVGEPAWFILARWSGRRDWRCFIPIRTTACRHGKWRWPGRCWPAFPRSLGWQRRKQPWMLVGWLWYLVMLLPVVGVIQVGSQAHADRYTYLPQIGIYVAVTWLVAEWRCEWPRRSLGSLMAGVVAVLMICAWKQTAYWKDSETLWTHTLACTTGNDVADLGIGNALDQKGSLDEAIAHYQKALKINPDNVDARNNLGNALRQKGRVDEAIAHYQKALQIKPGYAEAHYNLGIALGQKGRMDEAIAQYQEALQINPDYADAHINLGNALLQTGRLDEAIAHFQKALQINPDLAETHNNLGNAFLQKGNEAEAIAQFQQALQLEPDDPGSEE